MLKCCLEFLLIYAEPPTEQDEQITGVAPATDRTKNVTDNIITKTAEDHIDQMDNHMDAIQNEFINENEKRGRPQ